jgi:hypothetical protein
MRHGVFLNELGILTGTLELHIEDGLHKAKFVLRLIHRVTEDLRVINALSSHGIDFQYSLFGPLYFALVYVHIPQLIDL